MASRVRITQKKKRKSIVLTPRQIETVDDESDAVKQSRAELEQAGREGLSPESDKSSTLRVDDEDLREVDEVNVLDASDSMAVELNSSTVKDPVPQIPLEPEKAEDSPPRQDPGEPKFKFFCYRCGQRLKVPITWANKSIPCGRCGHDLVIPPPLAGQEEA